MTHYAKKIDCIRTTSIGGRKHITHISGVDSRGERWWLPGHEALMEIESGRSTYFMEHAGQSLMITVGMDDRGEKCLISFGGSLFDLPECPG